jgi:multimeric flavodoxin WrbA
VLSNKEKRKVTMKILGISGSGRPGGITAEVIKEILEATGLEYEYVSLAGKKINGCIACMKCVGDNICKQKDDWNEIGQKMLEADAIVFGAPDYYGTLNALAHACLERTYCFRHQERFLLSGKLGVVVGVDGWDTKNNRSAVIDFTKSMMQSNKMAVVDSVYAEGYSQCYTCGFGENCGAGSVVGTHGFIEKILPEHYPCRFAGQEDAMMQAHKVGKMLGSMLKK